MAPEECHGGKWYHPPEPFAMGLPIVSCSEAVALEHRWLPSEEMEWQAMLRAGQGLARSIRRDFGEIGTWPKSPNLLLLLGSGHNAGDALLAARELLPASPGTGTCRAILTSPFPRLRPLTRRAWDLLCAHLGGRFVWLAPEERDDLHQWEALDAFAGDMDFDLLLDGLLGHSFRPPLRSGTESLLRWAGRTRKARCIVAVDMPSGCSETAGESTHRSAPEGGSDRLKADFTYALGTVKASLFGPEGLLRSGRVRWVDLGFPMPGVSASQHFLHGGIVASMNRFRPARAEKRGMGHLLVLAGSRRMPGALIMVLEAALRSGTGLVTALVPESLAAFLPVRLPEVMWIPLPEDEAGQVSCRAAKEILPLLPKANAVVAGPGLGHSDGLEQLLTELIMNASLPLLLDADALRPACLARVRDRPSAEVPVVITPHAGEMLRIWNCSPPPQGKEDELRRKCLEYGVICVAKGAPTCITDGNHWSWVGLGGPVLARGGSGDLLAGLLGGCLARERTDSSWNTIQRAVAWHALAADWLAIHRGAEAVKTTDWLEALGPALRYGHTENFPGHH